jgi:hypothetical protein
MELRYAWLALIVTLGLGMAAPGSPPKAKMLLVVNFDVEDYTTPASEGIDDIPKWLAEIMSEEGVTGTFNVIGEKARSLEKRGRRDVIEAMAKHDIGSHTNFGSIHPTVTEELEKADWDGGVRHMLDQETAGFKDLERIFGVPVATMAIGKAGATNAAVLAAQILARSDPDLARRLKEYKKQLAARVEERGRELKKS